MDGDVHRAWVVNKDDRLEGVFSLSDVMSEMAKHV